MSEQRVCPGRHSVDRPARALRDDEYLCMGCVRYTERVIGDIPALVQEVETTVTRQANAQRAGGVRHGVVDEDWRGTTHALAPHPLPVDLDASTRARTSLELLFEWSDFVAEQHGKQGLPVFTKNKPLAQLTVQAVGPLLYYIDWLRSNEQGPDLAEAVRCVRRDLRRIVDCRPGRIYAGPCHADLGYPTELNYRCQLQLYRPWGNRDEIVCDGHEPNPKAGRWASTGCGTAHSSAERGEWLKATLDGALLPLDEFRTALPKLLPHLPPVPAGTWRSWVSRKQLVPHTVIDGVELFRGGSVIELLEAWAERTADRDERRSA